ncbi:MFS transporter [Serratia fonticola]|uniref:MFS transporter n=1 Tax=Serratia fonticola TaxID=47917 RepID=UPI0021784AB2|nr:MFS transporter [Serratia fonticola]CAI0784914.1 Inner membrane transport protein RhmT [Serratia fonticola]CAI0786297.1 Inner membrane transport protein RhmT [Serratia fonticola]CAI1614938.1 Inner membrane transport protein RhmT [Serratia fonticola]CAI1831928.1 Inner membrane transport protein RhmT [Serratia fonticola]CAI1856411.1 Inner membrane transport protein RhmT [Serratia fonticola]
MATNNAAIDQAILASPDKAKLYSKIAWRIMPILLISYIVGYLDRVGISFSKFQMMPDILQGNVSMAEAVYGLGAGVFFIGYIIAGVPSNILLSKYGARKVIALLMLVWGTISMLSIFITNPTQFYLARFLLGLAEAGFYPGVILYLTLWFPSSQRAKMTALFVCGIPVSNIIGGPLCGWIIENMNGMFELSGWQWLFFISGPRAVLIAVVIFFFLDNTYQSAKWLSPQEKEMITQDMAQGASKKVGADGTAQEWTMKTMLKSSAFTKMWLICFCTVMGQGGLAFWVPTMIRDTGVSSVMDIGLLTMLPYMLAVVAMLMAARSSDKHRERRWHIIVPFCIAAVSLIFIGLFSDNKVIVMVALCIAVASSLVPSPLFWSLPNAIFTGTCAAAGIALINSIANIGGFISPYIIGYFKNTTESNLVAMCVLSSMMILGAILTYSVPAKLVNK